MWTPHITFLDRGLTPRLLGQAVEMLARRPHRTWSIALESLAVTRRQGRVDTEPPAMALGIPTPRARPIIVITPIKR